MRDRSSREEHLVGARMGAMYDMLDNYIDANMLTTAPTIFRNVMIHMSDNVDDMRKYPPSGTYDMTSDERQRRIYDSLSSAYVTYVPNTSSYDVKNDLFRAILTSGLMSLTISSSLKAFLSLKHLLNCATLVSVMRI